MLVSQRVQQGTQDVTQEAPLSIWKTRKFVALARAEDCCFSAKVMTKYARARMHQLRLWHMAVLVEANAKGNRLGALNCTHWESPLLSAMIANPLGVDIEIHET